jgi:hypothetical protein
MTTRLCLILAAVALLWVGANRIRTAVSNRQLTTLRAADYPAAKPAAQWLELTDCFPSFMEAAVKEVDGKVTEVFVPLRRLGDDGSAPADIVLASTDPRYIGLARRLAAGATTAQRAALYNEYNAKGLIDHSVRGLVQRGADLGDSDREELTRLNLPLSADFVMLGHNEAPSLVRGLLFAACGVAILAYFATGLLRPRGAGPTNNRATDHVLDLDAEENADPRAV